MSLLESDLEDEGTEEDPKELYGIRDGTLFVIDATAPMFEIKPNEEYPYFVQCTQKFEEIIKQKVVWNSQDWMGLLLFGTEKWDMDPVTKNILTLQKLNHVSVEGLKEIMEINKEKWKYYRDIASSTAYPLHDVLWHAAQAFSSIKITMPMKRVLLFTCQSNPPMTDENEKHRIRVKAMSYNDIGIQLSVIGLGEDWNHDCFYKDLEMLSQKIDTEDYQRTSLQDLVKQVKLPSRNMAKLPWRLGENVTLDVSIRNLCVKSQYLKKVILSKESNTPLITHTSLKIAGENNEDEQYSESQRPATPVLETEIQKYQEFGGRKICFTEAEVKTLSAISEPGIDIICIKPRNYHPINHYVAPYFVTPSKSYRKDNKLLFGAILDKCDSRELMIVCAVTIRKRSAPNLYNMIPSAKNGGFYLHKIPFKEDVRDLSSHLTEFIYDRENRKPPTNPEDVLLLTRIIKKLRIQYDPDLFSNPKLQVQLQTIETLGLDLEPQTPPPDDTLPDNGTMYPIVKDLLEQYKDRFKNEEDCESTTSSRKKHKPNNDTPVALEDEESIRKLVTQGKVDSCTVQQLKNMLKTVGLRTSGKKEELIKKLKEHYNVT